MHLKMTICFTQLSPNSRKIAQMDVSGKYVHILKTDVFICIENDDRWAQHKRSGCKCLPWASVCLLCPIRDTHIHPFAARIWTATTDFHSNLYKVCKNNWTHLSCLLYFFSSILFSSWHQKQCQLCILPLHSTFSLHIEIQHLKYHL